MSSYFSNTQFWDELSEKGIAVQRVRFDGGVATAEAYRWGPRGEHLILRQESFDDLTTDKLHEKFMEIHANIDHWPDY